jgi:hypothetical protein
MLQPTELQCQEQAMLAVATITSHMAAAGVPQDVWPAWDFTHGNASGTFPDDPRSMIALSRWCQALTIEHGIRHRTVQRNGGRVIEWTVSIRVGNISVHIVATSPARTDAPARELVTA